MSAECDKCGVDLVYDENHQGYCDPCRLRERIAELERENEMYRASAGTTRHELRERIDELEILVEQRRDAEARWCMAMVAVLDMADVRRVLEVFLEHRDARAPKAKAPQPVVTFVPPEVGGCSFEKRGVAWECVEGCACRRRVFPVDEDYEAINSYYEAMRKAQEG